MGVGLVEYRVAIGRFAEFARRHRSKPKLPKPTNGKEKTAQIETTQKFGANNFNRRWASASPDRLKRGGKSRENGRRSKTLDPQMFSGNIRNRKMTLLRDRSHSQVKRGGTTFEMMKRDLRDACTSCKTNWFDQKWSRGRTKVRGADLKREKCCPQSWRESTNGESHQHQESFHLFTCIAVSECILLDFAVSGIVQMLLLMSGIERNPGPPPLKASCCKAGQHFNRVNNTKRKVQENFQSKVAQNTLTDQVIRIGDTGELKMQIQV